MHVQPCSETCTRHIISNKEITASKVVNMEDGLTATARLVWCIAIPHNTCVSEDVYMRRAADDWAVFLDMPHVDLVAVRTCS